MNYNRIVTVLAKNIRYIGLSNQGTSCALVYLLITHRLMY